MKFSAEKIKDLYKVKAQEFRENQREDRNLKKLIEVYIFKIKKEVIEAALEGKKEIQLSNFLLTDNWWNIDSIATHLNERGFYLTDKDREHFGLIFGQVDILEFNEKYTLNDELDYFLNSLKQLIEARFKKLKFTPQILKNNLILEVNILRKINLLSSINNQINGNYIDHINSKWFSEITELIFKVENFIKSYIPEFNFYENNRLRFNTELFNLTWRFPRESKVINELLTAKNISYISSNDGLEKFNILNDLIKSKAVKGAPKIDFELSYDDNLKLYSGNQIIDFELSETSLIEILETLGFKVNTNKNKFTIFWS